MWERILSDGSPRDNGFSALDEVIAEIDLYLGWYRDALKRHESPSAVVYGETVLHLMGLAYTGFGGARADRVRKQGIDIRIQLRTLGHELSVEGESDTDIDTDNDE